MPAHTGTTASVDRRADHAVAVTTTDGIRWTWDDLVARFAPAIAGYARSRGVRSPDDVVQDVLLAAVRRLEDFDGDTEHLRSWLFTLAYRRIADRHRQAYRSPLVLVPDHDPTPADDGEVDRDLIRSEALDDAMAAFDILDDRDRAVLHLRIVEEWTPAEVADELGLSRGNVRVIQSRALRRVRRHLLSRQRTLDRGAAGIMPLAAGFLGSLLGGASTALPRDGVLGAWVDVVRAGAAATGTGAPGAGTAAGVVAGASVAATGTVAGSLTAAATSAGVTSAGVTSTLAAAGIGLVVAVGFVQATTAGADHRTVTAEAAQPAADAAATRTTTLPTRARPGPADDPAPTADPAPVTAPTSVPALGGDDPAEAPPTSSGPEEPRPTETSPAPSVPDTTTSPATTADAMSLTEAGRLVLDPSSDTEDMVASLGGAIALRDQVRQALASSEPDAAASLGRVATATTDTVTAALPSRVTTAGGRVVDEVLDLAATGSSGPAPVRGAIDTATDVDEVVERVGDRVEAGAGRTAPDVDRTADRAVDTIADALEDTVEVVDDAVDGPADDGTEDAARDPVDDLRDDVADASDDVLDGLGDTADDPLGLG